MSYKIENEEICITFDSVTGARTGLFNNRTGYEAIRQPVLSAGIRLLVPIENHRNNRVLRSIKSVRNTTTYPQTRFG